MKTLKFKPSTDNSSIHQLAIQIPSGNDEWPVHIISDNGYLREIEIDSEYPELVSELSDLISTELDRTPVAIEEEDPEEDGYILHVQEEDVRVITGMGVMMLWCDDREMDYEIK